MQTKLTNPLLLVCVIALACQFQFELHAQTSKQRTRQRSSSGTRNASGERINRRAAVLNRATALAILNEGIPTSSHQCDSYGFGPVGHFFEFGLAEYLPRPPTEGELLGRTPIDYSSLPRGRYLDQKLLNEYAKAGIIRLVKITSSGPDLWTKKLATRIEYAAEPNPLFDTRPRGLTDDVSSVVT